MIRVNGNKIYLIENYKEYRIIVDELYKEGYVWLMGNEPIITHNQYPIILNADYYKTIMYGVVESHKERYFKDKYYRKPYWYVYPCTSTSGTF